MQRLGECFLNDLGDLNDLREHMTGYTNNNYWRLQGLTLRVLCRSVENGRWLCHWTGEDVWLHCQHITDALLECV